MAFTKSSTPFSRTISLDLEDRQWRRNIPQSWPSEVYQRVKSWPKYSYILVHLGELPTTVGCGPLFTDWREVSLSHPHSHLVPSVPRTSMCEFVHQELSEENKLVHSPCEMPTGLSAYSNYSVVRPPIHWCTIFHLGGPKHSPQKDS